MLGACSLGNEGNQKENGRKIRKKDTTKHPRDKKKSFCSGKSFFFLCSFPDERQSM
jgi:hypothetical protein